jgi:SulP family sulfate permease
MLRGYRRSWLRGDLVGGVTVAAYLIPQVMAYATVAGLQPVAGLWAALPALVVYALIGSSRLMSMGPEVTTALMTAIAIGPLAAGNSARYAELAADRLGTARRRPGSDGRLLLDVRPTSPFTASPDCVARGC